MSNYLVVGSLIKAQLIAATNHRIYTVRDAETGARQQQSAPCIFVSYFGEGSVTRVGNRSKVTQIWLVIASIPNEQLPLSGDLAAEEAGAMLSDIISELNGFNPGNGWSSLTHTVSPVRQGYDNKFLYYPVAFETTNLLGATNVC